MITEIFIRTDQTSLRKNIMLLFCIFSLGWMSFAVIKIPKSALAIFIVVFLLITISFFIFLYRIFDPKDKRPLKHPHLSGVSKEVRSGILGLYTHTFIFSSLPISLFLNLLSLEFNSLTNYLIYLAFVCFMGWICYRIDPSIVTLKNSEPKEINTIESDDKAANFFILGYILVMAFIAYLLYHNSI